ncbi:MAG: GIY-YIG nuclease family protein [bacterium]|nr:GIY-YIG nuclease family protein [bacterium]
MNTKSKNIPHTPGIYFFSARGGSAFGGKNKIIYIGKAKNLKERISSYFSRQNTDIRKINMVREATTLIWQETLSDAEALIQESELIKKYRPKYNIVMRDDKQYFYVRFSDEEFPRITLTHQPNKTQSSKPKAQSSFIGPFTDGASLKQTLKLLRRAFPYCTCKEKHKRICQHASIGNCLGICCIDSAYKKALFPDYTHRVSHYKKNVHSIKNVLSGKGKKMTEQMQKDMARLSRIQHYEKAALIRDQLYALENIFSHKHILRREETVYAHKGVVYLKNILHTHENPKRIEAYDISNIQGKDAVGSMVVFTDGKPDKNEYRKFNIRLPARPNDVGMMKEIIARRFSNPWPLPDVMVIDGGKAQLNAALHGIKNQELRIKVIALAKREEELYLPSGKIIKLKEGPKPLLHLLQYIRNEAHRFAITFHRRKRGKNI